MYNQLGNVEFDLDKARRNRLLHGISFDEAEMALRDPMALTIEDPDSTGEQRFITLRTDSLGRLLVVVHTPRAKRTRLISARKASRSEAEQFHAKNL
jgi:uncharacterized DUF497 family protein